MVPRAGLTLLRDAWTANNKSRKSNASQEQVEYDEGMKTETQLLEMSGPELVNVFNDLPGVTKIKRFRSKEIAVKRILSAQPQEYMDQHDVREMEKKQPLVAVYADNGPQRAYNRAAGPTPRHYRSNSNRGKLLAILMGEGAKFEDLLKEFPVWNATQLHRTLNMTSWWLGFELTTDDEGVIRASR